ncbi:hypothetical protein [Paractinoplanes abujensis]|uniref:Uncharacterized protein n=1 Tax=Paractinoplanes abujensis TaxID=882441 RepID=A0A7W7G356_9ACTN|nr:hypothetical protein [Actinoplanes abujensis]MBB4692366.1 hypothetical protein [Actinoplanes abujensis]
MQDAFDVLRSEFGSEPGSFMLALYADRVWDPGAFSRLEQAMRVACEECAQRESLERWLVEGFHYVSTWVPDHTGHPAFPRPEPASYYEACLIRLTDLADWFFHGWHTYQEPHYWQPL